jgi:hypothetical protein
MENETAYNISELQILIKDKFSQDDEDCPIQSDLHYFILSTHGKHQD